MQSTSPRTFPPLAAGVLGFLIWGAFPLFLKQLVGVEPVQVLAYRILFAALCAVAWLTAARGWGDLGRALTRRNLGILAATTCLMTCNWFAYIWGVSHNLVVEGSLGYFISPLVFFALGVLFLGEKLTLGRGIAIGVAVLGVAVATFAYGRPPYLALGLALSFTTYGLIHRKAGIGALTGLSLETFALAPIAAAVILFAAQSGDAALFGGDIRRDLFIAASGAMTFVPLVAFGHAARHLPFTTLGFLQYLSPTLQLATGVILYHEPFTSTHAGAFALIWLAIAIFIVQQFRALPVRAKKEKPSAPLPVNS